MFECGIVVVEYLNNWMTCDVAGFVVFGCRIIVVVEYVNNWVTHDVVGM